MELKVHFNRKNKVLRVLGENADGRIEESRVPLGDQLQKHALLLLRYGGGHERRDRIQHLKLVELIAEPLRNVLGGLVYERSPIVCEAQRHLHHLRVIQVEFNLLSLHVNLRRVSLHKQLLELVGLFEVPLDLRLQEHGQSLAVPRCLKVMRVLQLVLGCLHFVVLHLDALHELLVVRESSLQLAVEGDLGVDAFDDLLLNLLPFSVHVQKQVCVQHQPFVVLVRGLLQGI